MHNLSGLLRHVTLGKKTEVESKFNLKTPQDLGALQEQILSKTPISRRFWKENPNPYMIRRKRQDGVLFTCPQSWYVDTVKQDLRKGDISLRQRHSPNIRSYIQIGVKGPTSGFDGPGGLIRHEDERKVKKGSLRISPEMFNDPNTRQMLAPAMGQPLYYHFATDVKRRLIGIPVKTARGKLSIFEACFDPIDYIAPTAAQQDAKNPLDFQTEIFHQTPQLEIEYFNPLSDKKFARKLGIDKLSALEVEESLIRIVDKFQECAAACGVTLTPSAGSKASEGFEIWNALPEDKRPLVPVVPGP